ncbi:hypothetical protein [Streptomyces nigra]|uniref:hypothetical protein n=1 Tax=Streptomyces nigra TaxID=1827580 RepID=UPI0036443693
MALPKFATLYEAGDAWLADCSARPTLVRAAWDVEKLAPIESGRSWLVAEGRVTTGYQVLARIRAGQRGPALADPLLDKLWWLIPTDAAEDLDDVGQLVVHPPGWSLYCPPTGWQVEGRMWLTRPDGSGLLTNPTLLAAAFGPGGYRRPAEASS